MEMILLQSELLIGPKWSEKAKVWLKKRKAIKAKKMERKFYYQSEKQTVQNTHMERSARHAMDFTRI